MPINVVSYRNFRLESNLRVTRISESFRASLKYTDKNKEKENHNTRMIKRIKELFLLINYGSKKRIKPKLLKKYYKRSQ